MNILININIYYYIIYVYNIIKFYKIFNILFIKNLNIFMYIGDWGLGFWGLGVWGWGGGPPQPKTTPQTPKPNTKKKK